MIDLRAVLGLTAPQERPAPPPEPEESEFIPIEYDLLVAEQCRRSLHRYLREQWERSPLRSTPFEDGPHIRAICVHIQGQLEDAMARREALDLVRAVDESVEAALPEARAQNLLINCPPRSLKTIILTFANAWAWIRWPWMQIIYLSANPGVVLDSARLFRDIVSGEWYQGLFVRGEWKLRDDQDALSSMGNTAGGARRCKGFDARIIGAGADWLCIDDAHSMDDSADTIRSAVENYDGNISSRINDSRWGIKTAIMQRAGRGDFSDHVLGHGWFHLRIPMEFESRPECQCPQCKLCERREPNAFGWVDWRTTEGEVMHPRFTREYLSERMIVLRPHGYAGQMQQRPAPKEGNQFKVGLWRYFKIEGEEHPHGRPHGANSAPAYELKRKPAAEGSPAPGRLDVDWVCLTVDPSGGSTSADASALGIGIVLGKAERSFVLEDRTPGPATWLQTIRHISDGLVAAANLTAWDSRILVLIEKKALGQGAIEDLQAAIGDGKIKDRWGRVVTAKVEPYEPTGKGDKDKRAEFMEPMADAGLIHLLDGAAWLITPPAGSITTFVDEFSAFPRGARDDRIDYLSQCLDRHRKKTVSWVNYFK
jgi:phage terminase large subunit-like protein